MERVSVPDGILDAPAAQSALRASYGPVRSAEGLGLLPSPGLDAALETLAEGGGAAGSVRPTLTRAALAYARDVGRDRVDFAALDVALADAASPYRSAAEIAAHNIPALIAWAIEHTPDAPAAPTVPHFPTQGLPVAEAAARLGETVDGFFDAIARGEHPGVLGIKAGAGLGKTGAVLEALNALPGAEKLRIEIYVPDHALGAELAARVRAAAPKCRAVVIKGRGSVGEDGVPMCAKADLAARVVRLGGSVTSTLCRRKNPFGATERCEHFATCPFWAQYRDEGPAIRILSHAALFTPRNRLLPEPDLIVIDEACWQAAVGDEALALDRLSSEPEAAARLLGTSMYEDRVRDALLAGEDPRSVVTAEECENAADVERITRPGLPIAPRMPQAKQQQKLDGWRGGESVRKERFWELLAAEHAHLGRPLQRITVELDTNTGTRMIHLHYRKEPNLPGLRDGTHAPVLLLDADLDERIARKLFPALRVSKIPVRQQTRVVQVVDRPVSRRSLLGGGEGDAKRAERCFRELEGTARRLLAGGGLVVAQKAVVERLDVPGAARAHFGALRGRDEFKSCDTAVIVGRLEPEVRKIERQARALFGDEAEPLATLQPDAAGRVCYHTEKRCRRMADGTAGAAVDVWVHPDPRCQAILEQIRECEISQAVARVRGVHRKTPATVYLLTNIPIDLDVTETTTWAALTRDRAAEALERWGGIWLASSSERARCAPDLWATAEAARCDERRRDSAAPAAGCVVVEYRTAGQRGGRAHRAYVPTPSGRTAGDVRARLEGLVGPIVGFSAPGAKTARPVGAKAGSSKILKNNDSRDAWVIRPLSHWNSSISTPFSKSLKSLVNLAQGKVNRGKPL